MEDALQKLMKEAGSTKYAAVATSAHKALGINKSVLFKIWSICYMIFVDLLESYSRAPACEYRIHALTSVKHAFDLGGNASNSKMVFTAIVVLQKIIRDDRFHTKAKDEADEAESQWMSSQVINAIQGTDTLNEEQKQEVLKVTLALSCHAGWRLNGHLVIQILTFCIKSAASPKIELLDVGFP